MSGGGEQSVVTQQVGFTRVRLKLSRMRGGQGLRDLYRQLCEVVAEAFDITRSACGPSFPSATSFAASGCMIAGSRGRPSNQ